jgi:hypothetical protein
VSGIWSFLIADPLVMSRVSADDYYSREFIDRVFAIVKEAISLAAI